MIFLLAFQGVLKIPMPAEGSIIPELQNQVTKPSYAL